MLRPEPLPYRVRCLEMSRNGVFFLRVCVRVKVGVQINLQELGN